MALTEAEKQQIEAGVSTFLQSPNVQAFITNTANYAEADVVKIVDAIIAKASSSNPLVGALINALKGSAEGEVSSLVASLPTSAVAALATKYVESELVTLLGS